MSMPFLNEQALEPNLLNPLNLLSEQQKPPTSHVHATIRLKSVETNPLNLLSEQQIPPNGYVHATVRRKSVDFQKTLAQSASENVSPEEMKSNQLYAVFVGTDDDFIMQRKFRQLFHDNAINMGEAELLQISYTMLQQEGINLDGINEESANEGDRIATTEAVMTESNVSLAGRWLWLEGVLERFRLIKRNRSTRFRALSGTQQGALQLAVTLLLWLISLLVLLSVSLLILSVFVRQTLPKESTYEQMTKVHDILATRAGIAVGCLVPMQFCVYLLRMVFMSLEE